MRTVVLNCGFLCLFLASGCRPAGNHAPIHGRVTMDGNPLTQGSILFTPLDGQGVATGSDIKDGLYSIDRAKGPATGRNRVQISGVRGTGKMVQKPLAPQGEMIEMLEGSIPTRYNGTSTLEVNVQADQDNEANFELTSAE